MGRDSGTRWARSVALVGLVASSLLSACAGSDGATNDRDDTATAGTDAGTEDAASSTVDPTTISVAPADRAVAPLDAVPPEPLGGDPAIDCPGAYATTPPADGLNAGFTSAGQERAFHLLRPTDGSTGPRPLFLALTGTVQEERSFLTQSQLDLLPAEGWIVVAPVRNNNGILWPPWDAMRTPPIADQPNPDLDFFGELITCLGAHEDVDARRVYVGGISIGGTMTNYVLQRRSDLFAGGIVGSGNFVTTQPNDPQPLEDMVVVVAWGGDNDVWSGCSNGAMGDQADAQAAAGGDCVGSISFVEDAARASQYYAGEEEVTQVACTMPLGHIWLTPATSYMVAALLAHPKGMPDPYELPDDPPQPENLRCSTDPFVLP
jgi:poly(3-hydroxybutyrate) depolymerase